MPREPIPAWHQLGISRQAPDRYPCREPKRGTGGMARWGPHLHRHPSTQHERPTRITASGATESRPARTGVGPLSPTGARIKRRLTTRGGTCTSVTRTRACTPDMPRRRPVPGFVTFLCETTKRLPLFSTERFQGTGCLLSRSHCAGDACLPGICEMQCHRAPICETLSALHLPSSITHQRDRIAELESPGGEAKAHRQVDRFLNELI